MKILKEGVPDVGKFPYDTCLRCTYCRCEFQLELGDDWELTSSGLNDDPVLKVLCPHCKRPVMREGPSSSTEWARVPVKPACSEAARALLGVTGA